MESPSTEIFARNWRIYQEVSKCNYMSHHDFLKEIGSLFKKNLVDDKPINVLDCGCGDAWMLSRLLKGRNVNSFTGYDMSEAALSCARERLGPLECELFLQAGPMENLIKNEQKTFDLIYSSFATHHLLDSEKQSFLHDLSEHLKKGGLLIIIDLLRSDQQSRHQYIEEYVQNVGQTWKTVYPEDLELVYDHIRNFDFPAATAEFLSWVKEAGFLITNQFSPDKRNVMITAVKT